ncbi:MAG: Hsp70 family protein [Gammaproteobacteria bacterium]
MAPAIAIDFGTSRTKLALDDAGKARLKLWEDEKPYVPSLFYLEKDSERVFWGYDAEHLQDQDPAGLVDVLKRRLLERYVYANRRKLPPAELLTHFFQGLWANAREEVPALQGQSDPALHLTVPVYYGPAAEQVLRQAAQAAGFAEVTLVHEPVAAARAWLAEAGESCPEVVVLDCGGGTLDWAYLRRVDGDYRPVAECPPGGDVHVGGYDVDRDLCELVSERYAELTGAAPQAVPIHKLRSLKESYCKARPLRPLRIGDTEIALKAEEIQTVLAERCTAKCCDSLVSYLGRLRETHPETQPPVLLVGGSARIKGCGRPSRTSASAGRCGGRGRNTRPCSGPCRSPSDLSRALGKTSSTVSPWR